MQKESKIWLELKEISPLLAGMARLDASFEVPAGYFQSLPDKILSGIRAIENDSARDELKNLSGLISGMDKSQPYMVPAGYFENLDTEILSRVKASMGQDASAELEMLSPILNSFERQTPYAAPLGYFNELPENLAGGIKAIEFVNDALENLSPVLAGLKNENPYHIPDQYFESFPEKMLLKLKVQPQPARIVSFYQSKPWLKYAAAVVLTGILITIGLFTFNKHSSSSLDPLAALAKATDQEIVNFIATQDILVNEKANSSLASLEITDSDVRDLFDEIPDAELQQYVNERSIGKDLITN